MIFTYENWSSKVFNGLYESIIFNSDTFYNMVDGVEIPEGFEPDFKPNGYEEMRQITLQSWCERIKEYTPDSLISLDYIKPVSMWSPSEYNFYTDCIRAEVKLDYRKLKKYCFTTHKQEFDEYLHKNFTSRDGFWSFTPNNIKDYKEKVQENKNYVDMMFEFFLRQEVDLAEVNIDIAYDVEEWLYCNHCLYGNGCYWDFIYEDGKYTPTKKIA